MVSNGSILPGALGMAKQDEAASAGRGDGGIIGGGSFGVVLQRQGSAQHHSIRVSHRTMRAKGKAKVKVRGVAVNSVHG